MKSLPFPERLVNEVEKAKAELQRLYEIEQPVELQTLVDIRDQEGYVRGLVSAMFLIAGYPPPVSAGGLQMAL